MARHDDDPLRPPIRRSWPKRLVPTDPCGGFGSSAEFFEWLCTHLAVEGELTITEREICELLLLGRSYVDIAEARRISPETVKWHIKRILRKLGLESTRELLWVVGYRLDVLAES